VVLVAGVVGVAREDGSGAVDLLGEDDAGELVGEGDEAEREEEVGTVAGCGGPAVGGTDGEDQALCAIVAETAESGGEFFGGELAAAAVEEDGEGADAAGVLVERVEQGSLGIEDLTVAGDVSGDAGDVIGEEAVGWLRLGSGGAGKDGGEDDLHLGIPCRRYIGSGNY
jgi:hypothetical protein